MMFWSLIVFSLLRQIRTVKVCNLSLGASEQDIKEFFSFSGEIEYVEIHRLVNFTYLCTSLPSIFIYSSYVAEGEEKCCSFEI